MTVEQVRYTLCFKCLSRIPLAPKGEAWLAVPPCPNPRCEDGAAYSDRPGLLLALLPNGNERAGSSPVRTMVDARAMRFVRRKWRMRDDWYIYLWEEACDARAGR